MRSSHTVPKIHKHLSFSALTPFMRSPVNPQSFEHQTCSRITTLPDDFFGGLSRVR